MTTPADANKPFLDYLDKEMTIQGILSAFCAAAAGVLLDHVLGADHPSGLLHELQLWSPSFVVASGAALLLAAFFFYLQRSQLAWLHGQISFAITCDLEELSLPDDTSRIPDALAIGNSWSLWNHYKFGLSFICVSAAEASLALLRAHWQDLEPHKTIAGSLFLAAAVVDVTLWRIYSARDELHGVALKKKALDRRRGVGTKSVQRSK